jgi:hypothetical protein
MFYTFLALSLIFLGVGVGLYRYRPFNSKQLEKAEAPAPPPVYISEVDAAVEIKIAQDMLDIYLEKELTVNPDIIGYFKRNFKVVDNDPIKLDFDTFWRDDDQYDVTVIGAEKKVMRLAVKRTALGYSGQNNAVIILDTNSGGVVSTLQVRYTEVTAATLNANIQELVEGVKHHFEAIKGWVERELNLHALNDAKVGWREWLERNRVTYDDLINANLGGLFEFVIDVYQHHRRYRFTVLHSGERVVIEDTDVLAYTEVPEAFRAMGGTYYLHYKNGLNRVISAAVRQSKIRLQQRD